MEWPRQPTRHPPILIPVFDMCLRSAVGGRPAGGFCIPAQWPRRPAGARTLCCTVVVVVGEGGSAALKRASVTRYGPVRRQLATA